MTIRVSGLDAFIDGYLSHKHTSKPWYIKKEIRFYDCLDSPKIGRAENSLETKIGKKIRGGYKQMFDRVGLNFQCISVNSSGIKNKIDTFTSANGVLNVDEFTEYLYETRDGQYGQTIIVNRPLSSGDWGTTDYISAICFIRPISTDILPQHEAGRFLQVGRASYDCSTNWCMMQYSLPSIRLCQDCSDFIRYFWMGVEKTSGVKLFKGQSPSLTLDEISELRTMAESRFGKFGKEIAEKIVKIATTPIDQISKYPESG